MYILKKGEARGTRTNSEKKWEERGKYIEREWEREREKEMKGERIKGREDNQTA